MQKVSKYATMKGFNSIYRKESFPLFEEVYKFGFFYQRKEN